jgi:hypothetical protein
MKTTQNPIRVFFITLTRDERERLNDPETGGWESEPKFSRYASATCNADPVVIESAFRHGDYVHAATINQIDRPMNQDDAYFYVQNISEAWPTHEHVECHTDFPRSMMVGDLVEIDDEFFACAPCGWTKIDINAHMEGELLKQCHDCGDRLEDRDTRIVDLRDEVEPAGFVFLCPSCEHERIRKEEETVTCGACSVAIGAHTMDENCRERKIKDSKEAKKIASEFDNVEFWFDRYQKLWVVTDNEHEAASEWLAPGWLYDMTPNEFRDWMKAESDRVREYHEGENA